ncbi:hypothetical protein KY285_036755 [Solanum tuberosum]|nr:hypothetical protein KY285_036755 [Solanum tuberosum]
MEKCYNCGKKGHYARTAGTGKLKTSYAVEETNQQEDLVICHPNKEEEIALAIVNEKLVDYEHYRIVDLGYSNHMTGDEKNLINMSECKDG